MAPQCTHLDQIHSEVAPSSTVGCSECLKTGSTWVHLRECMTCGEVGCCDDSPNRHASKHAPCERPSDHPVDRARRGLAVVLRRPGRVHRRRALTESLPSLHVPVA